MSYRLIQWNTWVHEDIGRVASTLEELQPDIVCLQELTRDFEPTGGIDTVEYLRTRLGMYCANAAILQDEDKERPWEQCNAVFSSFPIAQSSTHWIYEPPHGSIGEQRRAFLQAELELPGDERLTVATTHMSYDHDFVVSHRKRQEADRLVRLVRDFPQRFILTGDFNELPDSYTVRRLGELLVHAGPEMTEPTWTTKPQYFPDASYEALNWRMDYVFGTPDIMVQAARTEVTDVSDHLPIVIDFDLSAPGHTTAG
jgi:endonuclease/exonuclease/phosphatase family metal-dependent hydrolase